MPPVEVKWGWFSFTLVPSHLTSSSITATGAAAQTKTVKRRKYLALSRDYIFTAFIVEILSSWGPDAHKIFGEKKVITNDPAGVFLV